MTKGTYVGPIERLKGKTALLQFPNYPSATVRAQFDDTSLTRSGKPALKTELYYEPHARFPSERTVRRTEEPGPDDLGYGWHVFSADHFTWEEV